MNRETSLARHLFCSIRPDNLSAVAKKRDVTSSWIAREFRKETSTLLGIWTRRTYGIRPHRAEGNGLQPTRCPTDERRAPATA